jgi:hypothetical protein
MENQTHTEYLKFLEGKRKTHTESGFEPINADWSWLYPFQCFCVSKALKNGRFALFEDCGLGKTRQQLTWANEVVKHTVKPVLILAPLAVVGQTIEEAQTVGLPCIEHKDWNGTATTVIANYEQLDNIDCSVFSGVVLDESSILKNFEGAYRNMLIDIFGQTPYKLCCTATPSPNDPMELGNHSEFLNIMPRNEMLAMYFVHDGGDTSKWRLKGHCEKMFWVWVSSWALMLCNPSDIGFSNDGYILPALESFERVIATPKKDNGQLFNDMAISATNHNAELRVTKIARLSDVVAILQSKPDESFIIWVKQNEEGETLRKMMSYAGMSDYFEVKGSDDQEWKKSKLLGFGRSEFKYLISKTKIAAMGMNFQNCHNMIFASPDFSFEGIYQALRRELRFGQKHTVSAWFISTDTMSNIISVFNRKQQQFNTMQKEMQLAMNTALGQKNKMEREHRVYETDNARLELGDCVQLIANVNDESVGFSVFSPPFADLYTYSDELEDMGNSKDYNEFLFAFGILAKELYRVLMSGRNIAIHCMDLPIQKGKEGYIGLRDFSNMIRETFESVGFVYHSRTTIWKDPVTEMQRTKALGLLHKQVKKDSTMSRVGLPDYVLVFRKDGERNNPVHCGISVDQWQKYASPVWMDIDYGDTLNRNPAREDKDEKHICPLQLETIERLITLYTNEGDTVFTPFLGIGSEIYQALKMNRKGIGFELKSSYFDVACDNIKAAEQSKTQLKLF